MKRFLMLGCGGMLAVALALVLLAIIGASLTSSSRAPAATTPPVSAAAPVESPPSSTPEPTAGPAHPGERASSAGLGVIVNSVTRTDSLGQFQKAKPGRTYVVLDVTIDRAFGATGPYNPLYFKLKDANGFEYTASLLGGDQSLKSGELVAGEKVRGTVAFDVPADAAGLVVSYQPIVVGSAPPIRIALD